MNTSVIFECTFTAGTLKRTIKQSGANFEACVTAIKAMPNYFAINTFRVIVYAGTATPSSPMVNVTIVT